MAELFQIEKPELKSPSTRDLSRPFSSRYFGLFLLGSLGITWILDFIILVTIPTQQNPANNDLNAELLAALSLAVFWFLFISIDIFAFLIWIYKVHQDLGRLLPHYPISPGRAVANVAIPFYNLYGIWKVFSEMSKSFVSQLDIWIRLLYLAPIMPRLLGNLLSNARISDFRGQLLSLSLTAIFFIITMKVQRALAGRFVELAATDNESTGEAVGEIQQNHTYLEGPADESAISPVIEAQRHSRNRKWIIALLGILLSLCLISACASATFAGYSLFQWIGLDYFIFSSALGDHVENDESISNYDVELSFNQETGEDGEQWMTIYLETPLTCSKGAADPCEQLADEIAFFTLQNYRSIDEIDRLLMEVTSVDENGPVSKTYRLHKEMTIPEWRKELAQVRA